MISRKILFLVDFSETIRYLFFLTHTYTEKIGDWLRKNRTIFLKANDSKSYWKDRELFE